jgi:tetratricopeptide (TPR) repeat protein
MTGVGEPYVGLRAYEVGDADRFFGRGQEAQDVATLWRGRQLLVLHGASGVGKTSLLQASVLPRIDPRTADVLPVGRLARGSSLPEEGDREGNPYTVSLLSSWSARRPPSQQGTPSITEFLTARPARLDDYGDPVPVFAAIDQFEELFGDFSQRQTHCQSFLDELETAVTQVPHLRLLLCVRDDYLGVLWATELARRSRKDRYQLLALTPEAALAAVSKPLEPTGCAFAPGVAEELVTRLRTMPIRSRYGLPPSTVLAERVEPVQIQVVCSALWRELPPGTTQITAEHLHSYGDVGRALADFYQQVVADVAAEQHLDESALRRWLVRTFVTEWDTRDTVYEGASATGGMPNEVVRALCERHLLRVEWRRDANWYELAHDRLLEPVKVAGWEGGEHEAELPGAAERQLRAAEMALNGGDVELAGKHAEEAVRLAAEAVQNDSGEPLRTLAEAETFLGMLARQQDQADLAEAHYRRAAAHFETLGYRSAVGRLRADIGALLVARGEIAQAMAELVSAAERLPGDMSVRVGLARAYAASGQPTAALSVYNNVLDVDPNHADALAGRGQLLIDLGDAAEGLAELDRLVRLHPDYRLNLAVRSARALALSRTGYVEEATAEVAAILPDVAEHGPALLRAGQVLLDSGKRDEAVDLLGRAVHARKPALRPYQRGVASQLVDSLGQPGG